MFPPSPCLFNYFYVYDKDLFDHLPHAGSYWGPLGANLFVDKIKKVENAKLESRRQFCTACADNVEKSSDWLTLSEVMKIVFFNQSATTWGARRATHGQHYIWFQGNCKTAQTSLGNASRNQICWWVLYLICGDVVLLWYFLTYNVTVQYNTEASTWHCTVLRCRPCSPSFTPSM